MADLSWAGKLFFAGVASFLGNKHEELPRIPIKIKVTQEQLKVIKDIIKASKEFQDAINKSDVSIEEVMEKIQNKNKAKEAFESVMKRPWPL